MLDQAHSSTREPDRVGRPIEKRYADLSLERSELVCDCGRCQVQRLGRRGGCAACGDLAQDAKAGRVQHRNPRFGYIQIA